MVVDESHGLYLVPEGIACAVVLAIDEGVSIAGEAVFKLRPVLYVVVEIQPARVGVVQLQIFLTTRQRTDG